MSSDREAMERDLRDCPWLLPMSYGSRPAAEEQIENDYGCSVHWLMAHGWTRQGVSVEDVAEEADIVNAISTTGHGYEAFSLMPRHLQDQAVDIARDAIQRRDIRALAQPSEPDDHCITCGSGETRTTTVEYCADCGEKWYKPGNMPERAQPSEGSCDIYQPSPEPLCPDCGTLLERVRQDGGYLNPDQFDAIKAGDWYCDSPETHDENRKRSEDGKYVYFWDRDMAPSPAPEDAISEGDVCEFCEGSGKISAPWDEAQVVRCDRCQPAPIEGLSVAEVCRRVNTPTPAPEDEIAKELDALGRGKNPTEVGPDVRSGWTLEDYALGYQWQVDAISTLRANATRLWTCPECAFTMDANHVDTETGEHSCPECDGIALREELGRGLKWERYKSDVINKVLSEEITALQSERIALLAETGTTITDLEIERDALEAIAQKQREIVKRCREFIKSVYDFRVDAQIDEGGMPFGTIDYYNMEDIIKEIDAIEGKT